MTFTKNQQRALQKLRGEARRKAEQAFRQQNRPSSGRQNNRASSTRVSGSNGGASVRALDAFHPSHLSLPRAVAPYSVVRTTQLVDLDPLITLGGGDLCILGPIKPEGAGWTNICGYINRYQPTGTMADANMWQHVVFENMQAAAWQAAALAPAAFSVQVMNPEALATTDGIVYIGRTKANTDLGQLDLTQTVSTFANSMVGYSNPRLCSAGKLASGGIQVDAVPANMSTLSDINFGFTGNASEATTLTTNSSSTFGFNPVMIYNPNKVKLQLLIVCEWRVRFDPSNPAYGSHSFHPPSTDSTWARLIQQMTAAGNGAVDIAEKVALMGSAVQQTFSRLSLLRGPAQLAIGM
jgi:hypothetical protein